jgi:hypothetical protein
MPTENDRAPSASVVRPAISFCLTMELESHPYSRQSSRFSSAPRRSNLRPSTPGDGIHPAIRFAWAFPGIQPAAGDGIDDAKIPSAPASFRFGAVEGLLEPARAHHLPRSPTTSRAEQRKGEENGWPRRREEARRSSTESRAAGDDVRRVDVLQLRAPLCLLQDPAMAARRRIGAWIRPPAATPTRPPWSPGAVERCRAGSEVAGREEGLAARRHWEEGRSPAPHRVAAGSC